MVPQIQQLAKSKGDALLLIELAKSAKTRNLVGGHLDSVGDLRSHFQQLQHRTSDEQLRKKIAQAVHSIREKFVRSFDSSRDHRVT